MPIIDYKDQQLCIEDVPLQNIAAKYGTPCYVYSSKIIKQNWLDYHDAFVRSGKRFKINYSVKANSNIHILKLLAQMGAGFDVVSGGEIARVLAAGGKASSIVFSGVGKTAAEINTALEIGIHSLNVESAAELIRINDLAGLQNKIAPVALRINPNVTVNTHAYTATGSKDNKFGIDYTKALDVYELASTLANIKVIGIAMHIGSQITTMQPFLNAIDELLVIIAELKSKNIALKDIDIGGGLGVIYNNENPPSSEEYVEAICTKLKDYDLEIHIEPGRSLVAKAGLLLTTVEYLKQTADNNFAIVDAAMNDFMRPALYQSYHEIVPVKQNSDHAYDYSVVGPICESGDFFAMQQKRKLSIMPGDLVAIKDCGAYGFSMSSNYNTRPRSAEVLVEGSKIQLIRKRETIEQLLANEYAVSS